MAVFWKRYCSLPVAQVRVLISGSLIAIRSWFEIVDIWEGNTWYQRLISLHERTMIFLKSAWILSLDPKLPWRPQSALKQTLSSDNHEMWPIKTFCKYHRIIGVSGNFKVFSNVNSGLFSTARPWTYYNSIHAYEGLNTQHTYWDHSAFWLLTGMIPIQTSQNTWFAHVHHTCFFSPYNSRFYRFKPAIRRL